MIVASFMMKLCNVLTFCFQIVAFIRLDWVNYIIRVEEASKWIISKL